MLLSFDGIVPLGLLDWSGCAVGLLGGVGPAPCGAVGVLCDPLFIAGLAPPFDIESFDIAPPVLPGFESCCWFSCAVVCSSDALSAEEEEAALCLR